MKKKTQLISDLKKISKQLYHPRKTNWDAVSKMDAKSLERMLALKKQQKMVQINLKKIKEMGYKTAEPYLEAVPVKKGYVLMGQGIQVRRNEVLGKLERRLEQVNWSEQEIKKRLNSFLIHLFLHHLEDKSIL